MAVVQVSPKGQVLIPKAIREKYGVKPGSNVHILEEPGSIIIKPALKTRLQRPVDSLREIFLLQTT